MWTEPRIEQRAARPYLGIAATTSLQQEAEVVSSCLSRLQAWMASRGLQAAGAPFVRYRRIEMPHRLDIEVCLPVAAPTEGGEDVRAAELPAGRYAALVHTGPMDGLVEANAALQTWLHDRQLGCAMDEQGPATVWAARIETSLTPPGATGRGDSRTEVAYLLR